MTRVGAQRPRLSHFPKDRAGSSGPDVVEFGESLGYELDDWQKWCLDGLFSEDAAHRLCAAIALLLVPRQSGKNVILEVAELYAFYVLDWPEILHTAHEAPTSGKHMKRLRQVIKENSDLQAITRVYESNGKERIERVDTRADISFITRTNRIGRGRSPRMIVFDEALYLTDDQLQAILPSISAQTMGPDAPLLIYASSAPLLNGSLVLRRLRRAILAGEIPQAFMAEWSVELERVDLLDKRKVKDRDLWYQANPGMGVRISEQWVAENELVNLLPEAFALERLGVVFEDAARGPSVLPGFDLLSDDDSVCLDPVAFALDVTPDRSMTAIGQAGLRDDGLDHLELLEHRPGTDWAVKRLVELTSGCESVGVAVDPAGPAGSLIGDMKTAGLNVIEMTAREMAQACGQLDDGVREKTVRWRTDDAITDAVDGAAWRDLGDAKAWSRKSSTSDISPLVTLTEARWLLHRDLPVGDPLEQLFT